MCLHLFSGVGHVSKSWRQHGFAVLTFDINDGWDLTDRKLLNTILGWTRSGIIIAMALGPPCSSWSMARRGHPSSPGGPLRTRAFIMGLPGLPAKDAQKVTVGNRTMRASARLLECARAAGVPASLENPAISRLFHAPPIVAISRRKNVQLATGDFCQYGAQWRKRTSLLLVNCGCPKRLELRSTGKKGVCSRSHRPHLVLQGPCKDGRPWTLVAQPYPKRYASALATVLTDASDNRHLNRLGSFLGTV